METKFDDNCNVSIFFTDLDDTLHQYTKINVNLMGNA